MSVLLRSVAFLGILMCGACSSGNSMVPVEGKVLYKGKEISNVVVTFHPKDGDAITTHKPSGLTDDAGTFRLMTGKDSGARPGEYTVTFTWVKEVPESKESKGMAMSSIKETFDGFQGTFADPSKSKTKITLKSESTTLEPFRLE